MVNGYIAPKETCYNYINSQGFIIKLTSFFLDFTQDAEQSRLHTVTVQGVFP